MAFPSPSQAGWYYETSQHLGNSQLAEQDPKGRRAGPPKGGWQSRSAGSDALFPSLLGGERILLPSLGSFYDDLFFCCCCSDVFRNYSQEYLLATSTK